MSTVTRYDCITGVEGGPEMDPFGLGAWVAFDDYEKLEAENGRLKREKAEQYQLAQYYRAALQEIRDRTPANRHKEWPHHHWYLGTATRAINHNMVLLQERLE